MSSDLEDKAKKGQRRRIPGRGMSLYEGPEVRVEGGTEREAEWGKRWGQEERKSARSYRALSGHYRISDLFGRRESY